MTSTAPTENNSSSLGNSQPAIDTPQSGVTGPANLEAISNSASSSAEELAIKDRIDDAIAKGPKKADQSTGGRVMVAEQGDLNELAASRRQST